MLLLFKFTEKLWRNIEKWPYLCKNIVLKKMKKIFFYIATWGILCRSYKCIGWQVWLQSKDPTYPNTPPPSPSPHRYYCQTKVIPIFFAVIGYTFCQSECIPDFFLHSLLGPYDGEGAYVRYTLFPRTPRVLGSRHYIYFLYSLPWTLDNMFPEVNRGIYLSLNHT